MNRGVGRGWLLLISLPLVVAHAEELPRVWRESPLGPHTATTPPQSQISAPGLRLSDEARKMGSWGPQGRWSVTLPEGNEAVLRVDKSRFMPPDEFEIRGHLEGIDGSEVLFTLSGDAAAASIRRPGMPNWQVMPLADGRQHFVRVPSDDRGPLCGTKTSEAGNGGSALSLDSLPRTREDGNATNILELGFFYTPAAEAGAGGASGMRALLRLAVLEANDAFARSGTDVQIHPVFALRVDYQESGVASWDLDRFSRDGDGWLDQVHDIRNTYAADILCLVTESEDSNQLAGIANQLQSASTESLSRGFALCLRAYLIGNYTLPHEIGHLLGCNHDRSNALGGGLEPWSFGTRIEVEGALYRTVMAYRPGLQFPYFSNPDISFRGVPTGIAGGPEAADNARTIRRIAPLVADIRFPAARFGFGVNAIEVSESYGTVHFYPSGNAPDGGSVRLRTVGISAMAGRDYVDVSRQVHLPVDPQNPIEVTILDNDVVDGPRQFVLEAFDPTPGLHLGPISGVTITIVDDETEPMAPLDTRFKSRGGTDGWVGALAATPAGEVIIGGTFSNVDGIPRARIARLRPDGELDLSFDADVKYRINALALLDDGRVALGGEFNTVNGARLNHVAILTSSGALDPAFNFDPGTDYPVNAILAAPGGGVLIAGAFTNVQGATALRVARLLSTGAPDSSFRTTEGPNDEVLAMNWAEGNRVWIGGRFSAVGGVRFGGIARLLSDGTLDAGFASPFQTEGFVRVLLAEPETGGVLMSGSFPETTRAAEGRVVRLMAGGAIDWSFDDGLGANGPIYALARDNDGRIWLAGAFTEVNGRPRNRVARLESSGRLDESFDPGSGPDDWVVTLATTEEAVFIGGLFRTVNGIPRGSVAALLSTPVTPPSFTGILREGAALRWHAKVLPGQQYQLEHSSDLRDWEVHQNLEAASDYLSEQWPAAEGTNGFLRIHRKLE